VTEEEVGADAVWRRNSGGRVAVAWEQRRETSGGG